MTVRFLLLCVVIPSLVACAADEPGHDSTWFEDRAPEAGLARAHSVADPNDFYWYWYRLSAGVAAGDYDGDGDVDLFVTGRNGLHTLYQNASDGTFNDVTETAGIPRNIQSSGALFVDVDDDEDLDLVITALRDFRDYLFINNGDGTFTEDGVARGFPGPEPQYRFGFGVAPGDYDSDGDLDLHITNWGSLSQKLHTQLLKNLGPERPGFFEDATQAAGIAPFDVVKSPSRPDTVYAFASAFSDLDDDGHADLAVVGDFGTSRMYWNNGNGTFAETTTRSGVGTDENGMGSTFGDYDGDGRIDWFVTSVFDTQVAPRDRIGHGTTGNRLYRNLGNRTFEDRTDDAGVRDAAWGWGSVMFDADNDGDLDIIATNGMPGVESKFDGTPIRFWQNDGSGRFVDRAAEVGLADPSDGRGVCVFDLDNDGDLDVFVANFASAPRLFMNVNGSVNHWLKVQLRSTGPNRFGVGARIYVQRQEGGPVMVRDVASASHFLGQSPYEAHFGLGPSAAPIHSVRVRWPTSSEEQTLYEVAADQTLRIVAE